MARGGIDDDEEEEEEDSCVTIHPRIHATMPWRMMEGPRCRIRDANDDGRGRSGLSLEERKVNGRRAVLKKVHTKAKDSMSYKCVLSPRVAEMVHHHFLLDCPASSLFVYPLAHAFFRLCKKS